MADLSGLNETRERRAATDLEKVRPVSLLSLFIVSMANWSLCVTRGYWWGRGR